MENVLGALWADVLSQFHAFFCLDFSIQCSALAVRHWHDAVPPLW